MNQYWPDEMYHRYNLQLLLLHLEDLQMECMKRYMNLMMREYKKMD